jgi:radical SAM superfamily enzyme YgiQ (UPF0313 family)
LKKNDHKRASYQRPARISSGDTLDRPNLFLIAASIAAVTGSGTRNKAFGIRLPLLGYPAISLAIIATLTPDRFNIRLIDEAHEPIPYEQPCQLALIVGLTHHMPNAYHIADRLRAEGAKVILGGFHVTALPEEALEHADSVILGEAEAIWEEVLEDFIRGSLKKKYDGKAVDLSRLPAMRRDLFNKKFYHPGEIIETTRGCAVGCAFCGVQKFFGRRYRVRPPEAIRKELMAIFGPRPPQARWKSWLARHWHSDIPYFIERRLLYVMDSNFISNVDHVRAILQVFKDCDIRWYGHTSLNLTRDESLLDLMAESGCMGVNIGFESLSQTTIDAMRKFSNRTADYADAIRRLHEREIGVMGTFIVGFDEDTPAVFDQIAEFAIANRLETAFTLILTPLPGTPLYTQMDSQGRIFSRNWSDYDHGSVTFSPKNMSPEQLHWGMRSTWRKIYSWRSIWQRIMTKPRIRPFFYLPVNIGFRRWSRLICSERLWPPPEPDQHTNNRHHKRSNI